MKKTIRLIYPQWQGADIARWIPEIENKEDGVRGYCLGALLLDFLIPCDKSRTFMVPVSLENAEDRIEHDGVLDRDIIIRQTKAALSILSVQNPDRIITFGGGMFGKRCAIHISE